MLQYLPKSLESRHMEIFNVILLVGYLDNFRLGMWCPRERLFRTTNNNRQIDIAINI